VNEMIVFNRVSKIYNKGKPDEVKALDCVSFHIEKGEYLTIIGSNGAGKSTLLKVITGEEKIDEGEILINGRKVNENNIHERARYIKKVTQNPLENLASHMTIAENMAIGTYGQKKPFYSFLLKNKKDDIKKSLEILGMELENRLDQQIYNLSMGQIQAVAVLIAASAIDNNGILLLDEHTGALDPLVSERIINISNRFITEKSLTAVMISHNIEYALKYGNRLIMMDKGRIVLDINKEEKANLGITDILMKFKEKSGSLNIKDKMII
jgi:putative ABC transport system ATP-binding protein